MTSADEAALLQQPGAAGEVDLGDGRTVRIRPISEGDAEQLVVFHDHLSSESVYLRFFGPHPHLFPAEVERFTHVDGRERVAFVAVAGDSIVAVGRYDGDEGTSTAEVAFVVADDYQHHGIATALLSHLAEAARQQGIDTFVANTLFVNQKMRRVFSDAGYQVHSEVEDGVVRVEFRIDR